MKLGDLGAKNDAFFAPRYKFEIDFDPRRRENEQNFILRSIVKHISWSKYDTKMIFGAIDRY